MHNSIKPEELKDQNDVKFPEIKESSEVTPINCPYIKPKQNFYVETVYPYLETPEGMLVLISKVPFVIGKKAGADLLLSNDPTISRKHAQINKIEEDYYLEDLNSSNCTFVNDMKIEHPVKLEDGISFRLSKDKKFTFIFRR